MLWAQNYNPLGSSLLSMLAALAPVIVLVLLLLFSRLKPYQSAIISLLAASLTALFIFRMPLPKLTASAVYGALYGFLPIGWIVLNVIFLFNIFTRAGVIAALQDGLTRITPDKRLQLLLVAFCFGGLVEGAAGFGTPVAITASILIGLGFSPLDASTLSLIANTAPVAFGGLGTPIVALQGVTGLDLYQLSGTAGALLAPFALIIPVWLIWTYAGWKQTRGIIPLLLISGASFSLVQFLVSRLHGPWLVGVLAGLVSLFITALAVRTRNRRTEKGLPKDVLKSESDIEKKILWLPWLILVAMVLVWGIPQVKSLLDAASLEISVPFLDRQVLRMPPVVPEARVEPAVFRFSIFSATGTAIMLAGIFNALLLGCKPSQIVDAYKSSFVQVRFSLVTISVLMALGFVTRYSGMDASIGLVFAGAGVFYPFVGTLLGWLGVALTGSDTASNVLFGSLQRITAEQLGINPVTISAANSAGGVMGKMIDAQSVVVAGAATRWNGHEGEILRRTFVHSIVLTVLVGLVVTLAVYL